MRRKPLGRTLGLSLRMAVALAGISLLYLFAIVVLAAVTVGAALDGEILAALGGLMFLLAIPVLLVQQARNAGRLLLRATRARILGADEEVEVHGIVRRAAAQAELPAPRVALARSWAPNAFAVGHSAESAVVAVTTELLRRLEPGEIEAVVAHELAHIANRDTAVMTFVSGPASLGSWAWNEDDPRGKVFFAMFLPFYVVGLLLMWTISRYREYVADAGAVLITGAPEHLMSALQKIGGTEPRGDLRGGAAVSAFCIVPAQRSGRLAFLRRIEVFMDHPPLEKRLARLAAISAEMGRPV